MWDWRPRGGVVGNDDRTGARRQDPLLTQRVCLVRRQGCNAGRGPCHAQQSRCSILLAGQP
jgi:hypothetical protein